MTRGGIVLAILAALITVIAAWFLSGSLEFQALNLARVTQILTNLLLVALVIERALEVFITAWRQSGRANFDANIKRISQKMQRATQLPDGPDKERKLNALSAELKPFQEQLEDYKAATQVLALRAGVMLGLLTAAVGYRLLTNLVDDSPLTGFQQSAYVSIDVLLTGGLLAGGSKGIHALTQVFGNYLDTMAEAAKVKT